ncbi:MAG TPA: hypothetical protein VF469_39910, partial [Kofleriaceae bacterium]
PAVAPPAGIAPLAQRPSEALSSPPPPSAPELVIDHLDIRVVTESPAAPERRAPAPQAVSRSGAWNTAARHYLGRLS